MGVYKLRCGYNSEALNFYKGVAVQHFLDRTTKNNLTSFNRDDRVLGKVTPLSGLLPESTATFVDVLDKVVSRIGRETDRLLLADMQERTTDVFVRGVRLLVPSVVVVVVGRVRDALPP